MKHRRLAALALVAAVSLAVAAVFAYRPSSALLDVGPPSVWFEDPGVPGVYVSLYRYKTRAEVDIVGFKPVAVLLWRSGGSFDLRNKTVVDENFYLWDFPGETCTMLHDPVRGVYLQSRGNPTVGGITYPGCVLAYRWGIYSDVLSASFLFMTTDAGTVDGVRGTVLINSTTGWYYLAGIRDWGDTWYFGIYKNPGERYTGVQYPRVVAERGIAGRVRDVWFIVSLYAYSRPDGSVLLRAWLYNVTGGGRLVAYLEAVDTARVVYKPDRFGLAVYEVRNQPTAYFQMVGFASSDRVEFRGLLYSCTVEVYDGAGTKLGTGHADEHGVAVVVLSNPVVAGARVVVSCYGRHYEIWLDYLYGGDVYDIRLVFDNVFLHIYAITPAPFTGRLVAESGHCTGRFYAITIWLYNTTHYTLYPLTLKPPPPGYFERTETDYLRFRTAQNEMVGWLRVRAELYIGTSCYLTGLFEFNWTRGVSAFNEFKLNLTPP